MRGPFVTLCAGLVVLLVFHFTDGQILKAESVCRGEKRDLCEAGTVCELNDVVNGKIQCRVTAGNNCTGLYYGSCATDLICSTLGERGRVCALQNGKDCTGRRDLCSSNDVCNFINKCRKRVGAWCPTYSSSPFCGVGAYCNKTTGTCKCLPGVAIENDQHFCVPAAGRVGARCGSDNSCVDPNASCNTTSMTCHCDPTFTPHWPDFSCRLAVGQACPGPNNGQCEETSVCDTDGVCKLKPRESCAGDRSNLCQSGTACIDGVCRSKIGKNCTGPAYRVEDSCEPGTYCAYGSVRRCGLNLHAFCGNYTEDMCLAKSHFCDRVTNTCKIKVGSSCSRYSTKDCAAGATCKRNYCRCKYTGKSFASDEYTCALPRGAVGAKCGTKKEPRTGCSDRNARCKNKMCECKNGFRVNPNTAECELEGPTCAIHEEETLQTFFNHRLPVNLPCSFKMASFKCGGVKVEISASKMYSKLMEETYVSDVTINVTSTKNDVTSTLSYYVSNNIIQKYRKKNHASDAKSGSWKKMCCTGSCPDDRKVKDSISTGLGDAVFKRRRLLVTFRPLYSRSYTPPTQYMKKSRGVSNSVPLFIQCGHSDFESYESYPEALCGKPDDTKEDVDTFQRELELESRQELPDSFGYIPDEAFLAPRLMDHAVFRRQGVKHTDARCEAVWRVVSGGCTQLHEKMYNCSKMYDAKAIYYSPFPPCVQSSIEPTELYLICIRALCNVPQQLSDDTCNALEDASKRCDKSVGRSPRHPWIEPPPFITIAQLKGMTNCP